ncbi:MAG TPA: P-loop NTPase, partial [Polyangiales bacterium]|nr:P-loop NTPase [Polyangiales bacterium]
MRVGRLLAAGASERIARDARGERFGMKLMSIGFLIESAKDAIIWRGPMVQGALNQFLADVAWGPLDYL